MKLIIMISILLLATASTTTKLVTEMASTLGKLVASDLPFASSSRFFNTEAFRYVQTNFKDKCILTRDEGCFTVAQAAINDSFSPHVSPVVNLARLLNKSDELIGLFLDWPDKLPRWMAFETDEGLCILRDMAGGAGIRKIVYGDVLKEKSDLTESGPKEEFHFEEYVPKEEFDLTESVPKEELMSPIYKNNVKESGLKSEFMSKTEIREKGFNESVSNKETVGLRDLRPFIDLMRGVKSEPCDYYYHVMDDHEEINAFADSILGTGKGKDRLMIGANLRVCSVLQNPAAVYIVVGVEAKDTSDVYGGYVFEIFVDDSLYNIRYVEQEFDHTNGIWKITIPKKKGERTQRISGNLIFYREEKKGKPTVSQPK